MAKRFEQQSSQTAATQDYSWISPRKQTLQDLRSMYVRTVVILDQIYGFRTNLEQAMDLSPIL